MASPLPEGPRISRIPPVLRRPALRAAQLVFRARSVFRNPAPRYVYESDGMATAWHSPFLKDREWQARYDEMAKDWFTDHIPEIRWRMWMLTEFARYADGLGSFAEFGTYRGGCAFMMLSTTTRSPLHMFDTFEGIPATRLTEKEQGEGFAGRLSDTSVEHVKHRLASWPERTHYYVGDVFDTLGTVETGTLSLVHLDMNAAEPTRRCLEFAYPRLRPGGVIVFDDYGFRGYEDQRRLIDEFFDATPDRAIALPTGQGFVLRRA